MLWGHELHVNPGPRLTQSHPPVHAFSLPRFCDSGFTSVSDVMAKVSCSNPAQSRSHDSIVSYQQLIKKTHADGTSSIAILTRDPPTGPSVREVPSLFFSGDLMAKINTFMFWTSFHLSMGFSLDDVNLGPKRGLSLLGEGVSPEKKQITYEMTDSNSSHDDFQFASYSSVRTYLNIEKPASGAIDTCGYQVVTLLQSKNATTSWVGVPFGDVWIFDLDEGFSNASVQLCMGEMSGNVR
ncbi:hypothetical protein BDK51DRAFT_53067 [Blyttiomyces helicus]|uniref:Uncharacterized protein n=1 Tax=Blyttiomyces helicus TaxID=388810 RepID=A0A4P9WD35_9FUNG|nr:hypothetical protein BDK51DRAFT_53067 [Blyttiomyces helicus]|eukprot:RKO88286.1 hypothetical protein BDK51DRAFT_53067 [Blyttiomyces helicus]